jgi:PAS domain S-box-containing protein
MKSKDDARYFSLAAFLIPLVTALYGSFRVIDFLIQGDNTNAVISAVSNGIVVILLILLRRRKRFLSPAFYEPMMIFLLHIIVSMIQGTFVFFFSVSMVVSCFAAVYMNSRKLLQYILISNLITLVLIIFRMPHMRLDGAAPNTEVLVNWVLEMGCSAFVYHVTRFASDKRGKAARAENSFRTLLVATPNRIALLDSLNRITFISDTFAEMTGLENPELAVGRPILDLFNDITFRDVFIDILSRPPPYEDIQQVRLDGELYYFKIITRSLQSETAGLLIDLIDMTPEVKAKFEAEAASRSKSSFLATMSHEIRTPLNAIIGLSEIELQKKLPSETHVDLEKIYSSGSSLLGIINDILDISKIEAGNLAMVPVNYDIPSLVNDTVNLNIMRIGSKPIVFELVIDESMPIRLNGDDLRVKQILSNLLSNAFKYTDEGKVTLQILHETEEDRVWLTFIISDMGRGIRKDDIPRLFSEYSQLDTQANRHIEGTGLGLAITRKLAEMMNGGISVESEYGKGSVFTVRICQELVDKTPIGKITAENLMQFRFMENRRSRGVNLIRTYMPYGRILVVDDVATNLDVARGLMLPYGLDIDCASSGPEAIEKIRALGDDPAAPKYDVILMDHMMPNMDGIEAVRIIRSEINTEYARTVPIIALTANALVGNEELFLSNGFNAYISKPIDIMQLDVALNTWVRNKQSEDVLWKAESEYAANAGTSAADSGLLDRAHIEGVDLIKGKEQFVNEAAYLSIIRSYCIHTKTLLDKMRAVSGETLAEYAVTVHGLKGSSYGVCADKVGKMSETLEMAAKAGDLETVLANNGKCIAAVETLLAGLEGLLRESVRGNGGKQAAAAPDAALLDQLLEAAKRFKTTEMETIINELERYEYESEAELVPWLRSQLDDLEYDAIQERLKKRKAAPGAPGVVNP